MAVFADIQKERDSGKNMTVILTDRVFLVAYNLIEIPMMIKVKEIKSCFVNLEGKMYVVYFEKYDGKKEGFRLYEQKIACRIYDIFKQINLENIRKGHEIDKIIIKYNVKKSEKQILPSDRQDGFYIAVFDRKR